MPWYPLRKLILPFVLLLISAYLRGRVVALDEVYQPLLSFLPYVTLGGCLALSAYYNRSRLFAVSLALLCVYFVIQLELQVSLSEPRALLIYSMISVMLPLTLLFVLFLPERGLVNRYGLSLIIFVLLQPGLVWWSLHSVSEATTLTIVQDWMSIKPYPGYVLSLLASGCFIVVFMVSVWRLYKDEASHVAVILTALLFSFTTLAFFDQESISVIMFSVLGFALTINFLASSYDMAYRDELTGLLGRRALNDKLKGLGRQYVIAMMDVDHFKKFNDTYGHDVGDDVLKMVAKQIAAVKGGGLAFRYGGEEFSIVFSGKDIEYCEPFLEAVRIGIEKYRMTLRDSAQRPDNKKEAEERRGRRRQKRDQKTVSVTISIGMAERGEELQSADEVLKAADAALYKAKKAGRNRLAY